MNVDAMLDLQAAVADLKRRLAVLEKAGKPLADQLTPPIFKPTVVEKK